METILNSIPEIIGLFDYIVPGMIACTCFSFLSGEGTKQKDSTSFSDFFVYVVVSVLIRAIAATSHKVILPSWKPIASTKLLLLCMMAIVGSIILFQIWSSLEFSRVLSFFTHRVVSDDVFNDLIDLENGAKMTIVTKTGETYIGYAYMVDNNKDDSWIALADYYLYLTDGQVMSFKDTQLENLVLLRRSDIAKVFYTYSEESKVGQAIKQWRTGNETESEREEKTT